MAFCIFERLLKDDILNPFNIISLMKLMYSCQAGDASLMPAALNELVIK